MDTRQWLINAFFATDHDGQTLLELFDTTDPEKAPYAEVFALFQATTTSFIRWIVNLQIQTLIGGTNAEQHLL